MRWPATPEGAKAPYARPLLRLATCLGRDCPELQNLYCDPVTGPW
jgi:hypothetical protein